MGKTAIEYLDYSWSPIAMRCTPCSPACDHCWHLRMCDRMKANPTILIDHRRAYAGDIPPMITDRIGDPFHIKKPSIIGTQLMGDLFLDTVRYQDQLSVWLQIEQCPHHQFLLLTKRPANAKKFFDILYRQHFKDPILTGIHPPKNLWLGCTVWDQESADKNLPLLLQIPAAKHWVSYEPALGPVSLRWITAWDGMATKPRPSTTDHLDGLRCLDWVVAGGENGPGARPAHPQWFRDLRDQCRASGTPFFFKGFGEYGTVSTFAKTLSGSTGLPYYRMFPDKMKWEHKGNTWVNRKSACVDLAGKRIRCGGDFNTATYPVAIMDRIGKRAAARLLDGRTWEELPKWKNYPY